MTGDQHTDHISTGQQLSQHPLPTLLRSLFSHRTIATFGFTLHTSLTLRKTKNATFCQRTERAFGQQNGIFTYFDQL